jgi:hypothetical protein
LHLGYCRGSQILETPGLRYSGRTAGSGSKEPLSP